ncbi:ATP-binding protein [Paenibacillus sp. J5C_2022]|nr:ATP-binding protein [Paenibacillus sp. J5C2022]
MKPINRRKVIKYLLLIILYLTVMLSLRLWWLTDNTPPEHPHAVQGVVDLRGWDFKHSPPITLDGEWEFYPNQLLLQQDLAQLSGDIPQFISVPSDWKDSVSGDHLSYGTGTYRLRILLNPDIQDPLALWLLDVESSSIVEINGEKLAEYGKPGTSRRDTSPRTGSYTVTYEPEGQSQMDLLIQVGNYVNPRSGGLTNSIQFASVYELDKKRFNSIGLQLATFIILLLHSLYCCILYFFNRKQTLFLVFLLLLLTAGATIITSHDGLLHTWLFINYTWSTKLTLLAYLWFPFFTLMLAKSFLRAKAAKRLWGIYRAALILYSLFILAAPIVPVYYSLLTRLPLLLYLFPLTWCIWLFGKLVAMEHRNAVFLLIAAASVASSVLWGIFLPYEKVGMYYPIDIITAIIGFSSYWFKKYILNAEENAGMNMKLMEADKLKDQFLANTSHELRTPLHGIISIAQNVATSEKASMSSSNRKDMELLVSISRRMSYLLDDLLEIAQLREGRIVLQKEQLRIGPIASGIIDMLHYRIQGKPVELQMNIRDDFPLIEADEQRLVQILINLVQNAVTYTDEGVIEIAAATSGSMAIISVTDSGIGMDKDTQANLFQPYEQGITESSSRGGIGLGLSISKQLVILHGGDIAVISEPGRGSTFSFTLPLSNSGMIEAARQQPLLREEPATVDPYKPLPSSRLEEEMLNDTRTVAVSARTFHILAVDDDPINLKVLTSILPSEQYSITCVSSGQEALRLLRMNPWDLLIIDVMMPHMSGYELTRRIREQYALPELPILLLTARSQPTDIYAGFMAGANDYIAKPVNVAELNARIEALAALKHSVKERLQLEAAYLQAQIQPHFLFNTLNSIMALSHIDQDKMSKLIKAFTSYLRISFDFLNAGELVPLQYELELVRTYLYIEKQRFEERLDIRWEADSSIGVLLPPLTIQPLVENAVKHGLHAQREGVKICIRISRQGSDIRIEVEDNGKGMDQHMADKLLLTAHKNSGGIGVYNTNRRLLQLYGSGLAISSRQGEGTTVSFRIPWNDT